jgi:hypothetical protein
MDWIDPIFAVSVALVATFLWRRASAGWDGSHRQTLPPGERLACGPQCSLHLVREGKRILLVQNSPAGCTVTEFPRENKWN